MPGTQSNLIDSVLKVIISTPNLNHHSNEEFETLVLKPTQQLQAWETQYDVVQPESGLALECLRILRDILEAKGICLDEQRDHISDIIKRHDLDERCGHFLAEMLATKFARA